MPPLPSLLNQYIVRTDIKVNKSNLKTFCKPYIEKCDNFFAKTNEEEREKIFAILQPNNNDVLSIIPQKRSYSISSQTSQVSLASSSFHKVINCSLYYGPMDNYIVRSLSKEDLQKFYMLLLRLTVSCGWALSWVNKPEAKALFDFLNPFLKLSDRHVLGGDILKQVMNVKNEQLLGTVLLASNGKPYVWKAVDISSELTDSASAYAAARRRMRISNRSIIFLPCFAYQINLCVGEIFKESTEFKTTIDRETRWNSLYNMCISLLKTQQALQILAINFKPPIVETHDTLATRIISRLEKRWKDWEQPLLLLSYLLHPEYRMNQFNNATSINYSEFGKCVSTNELGLVACRIFGICVNASSVERFWSCMGFLQIKRCNRLMSSKALQMSKLRADITYGHRLHNNPILIESTLDIDDANETDTNQNPGNLNGLENNRGNDSAINLETNPKPIVVDYDSDDEVFEPQLENDFGEYLQGWTEILKEEENAEIDEVDEESNTSLDDITHPANDTSAKWELITLFNNNIDVSLPF
ncbi:ribonuclease H-like domain-containing protein [Rhizophagus diaphanus]|nr:ribonuclease H-like domain-containing protein [Rhizophagus diaphanus] [Rhizophagus sp. MUCL 43196]